MQPVWGRATVVLQQSQAMSPFPVELGHAPSHHRAELGPSHDLVLPRRGRPHIFPPIGPSHISFLLWSWAMPLLSPHEAKPSPLFLHGAQVAVGLPPHSLCVATWLPLLWPQCQIRPRQDLAHRQMRHCPSSLSGKKVQQNIEIMLLACLSYGLVVRTLSWEVNMWVLMPCGLETCLLPNGLKPGSPTPSVYMLTTKSVVLNFARHKKPLRIY